MVLCQLITGHNALNRDAICAIIGNIMFSIRQWYKMLFLILNPSFKNTHDTDLNQDLINITCHVNGQYLNVVNLN